MRPTGPSLSAGDGQAGEVDPRPSFYAGMGAASCAGGCRVDHALDQCNVDRSIAGVTSIGILGDQEPWNIVETNGGMGATMDCCSTLLKIPRASVCNGLAVAVVAAALALVAAAIRPAFADDNTAAASDQQCLGCHGSAGMEKKLEGGGTLQLHVPADMFAKSVHSAIGCTGCHSDIDVAAHPPAENDIPSARGFSIAMTQVCRGCHTDKFDQWETSIHAALILSNNPAAPICTDCHNPHAVVKGAAISMDQIPCKKCHVDIYTAYLGSMHAKARLKSEQSYAPICTDCHSAHAVQPTSVGQGPEAACFGCHAGVLEAHDKWLPNAALHFEVVSCPACH